MHSSPRRALYAQLFGLFCVVAGTLALIVVGIGIVVGVRNGEQELLPWTLVPYLVLGVLLVVVGRVVSYRYGGGGTTAWVDAPTGTDPDRSSLEELGYVTPDPEEADATRTDPDSVQCPQCGQSNDATYDYCSNCTARIG